MFIYQCLFDFQIHSASQFFITLRDDLDYLDDKHTIFGQIAEGFDELDKINR